ncbi:MAG: hypothetical protein HZA50_11270 [Planctomycetes bacterium]|nr:hypothetical protein [Planctomycetota bacterium]
MIVAIAATAAAVGAAVLAILTRRVVLRPAGDRGKGLVIFVESIRWLGVRWGMRSALAGLRMAGYGGGFLYWPWHAGWRGWLVLPAIMDRKMLEGQARRLAGFITRQLHRRPDRPIRLIGYSCGGFIALRAMELLEGDLKVDSVALMAAAFDPARELSTAARHVTGRLVVASSRMDFAIAGLGTLIFGTADRVFTPSIGMVGPRSSLPANVVHLRWRPADIRLGHLGGHFHPCAKRYIARIVAPHLGMI